MKKAGYHITCTNCVVFVMEHLMLSIYICYRLSNYGKSDNVIHDLVRCHGEHVDHVYHHGN